MKKILVCKCTDEYRCHTLWLILLLFMCSVTHGYSQQQSMLKGIVTSDTDGEPLIGVSVLIKGIERGTVTCLDGDSSLSFSNG